MALNIPFFRNMKDETHCLQTCMMMVLKYHFPKKEFTFGQIDRAMMVNGKKAYITFSQAVVVLDRLGLECTYITRAKGGYEHFLKIGISKYYRQIEKQSPDVIEDVDLRFSKTAWDMGLIEEKRISLISLREMLDKDCLVIAMVDHNGQKEGMPYDGHTVLIKSIGKESIILNDPGPSAIEDRKLKTKDFLNIWHDPDGYRSVLVISGKKQT